MASNKNAEDSQDFSNDSNNDMFESTDFFESEISRYSANLEADPEVTYRRYGFTLYHSLPPAQMVLENQKLGFFRGDSVDTYNLAGIELGKENYKGATELLEKALKEDPTLADAAYNLALCYERQDRKADALSTWNKYLEVAEDEEDLEEVRAHVAELQG
jgi:tetratricopeptide (TPR) repeat protein